MGFEGVLDEPLLVEETVESPGVEDVDAWPLPAEPPRAIGPLGEWIALVAARDEKAMRQLHRALATQVRRVVSRVVSDPHLADEVVGECFWQVWREAPHFDVMRGSVATWVSMIARSRALDAVRKRKSLASHEEPLMAEHEESWAAPEESPLARLEQRRRERSLNAALERIDPVQRQVLSLSFAGGLSHEQVARHCGLALGTVKSHIRRGLTQMRVHCARAGLQP